MNSWKELFEQEGSKLYYQKLSHFLVEDAKKYTVYPSHQDLLTAFNFTPLDKIKIVILGQDPYHGDNQAHGLAFSVRPSCPIPPSLNNIFKEINSDLQTTHTFSGGYLIDWAKQGVFLLNSILTVRHGHAGSHKNVGWETFTDTVISTINDLDRPIVFMLWGAFAKSKAGLITNPKHCLLWASHPSPLSAYNGFFGCKHFSKANQFLTENNSQPINWLI